MNTLKSLVNDPDVYIESAGKDDRNTVREAIADEGADTTLRVCFGLTEEQMPIRALGYYASAILLHEKYFPAADVQFIFPSHTAEAMNGIDRDKAERIAENTQINAHDFFSTELRMDSDYSGYFSQFYDLVLPDRTLRLAVAEILEADTGLKSHFESSARTRGTHYVGYVAAHLLMHDTNPPLTRFPQTELNGTESTYRHNGRIISIGAQSERPFYLARMAAKKASIIPVEEQVETGQLFTRHTIPPYTICREGEPTLEAFSGEFSTESDEFLKMLSVAHAVPSIEKDLDYVRKMYHEFFSRKAGRLFMTWDL